MLVSGIRKHAKEKRALTFGAGIDKLLGGGRTGAYLIDERSARAADDQDPAWCDGQTLGLRFRIGDKNFSGRRGLRKAQSIERRKRQTAVRLNWASSDLLYCVPRPSVTIDKLVMNRQPQDKFT